MQTRDDKNHTSHRRTPMDALTVRNVPSAQFFRSLTRKCGEKMQMRDDKNHTSHRITPTDALTVRNVPSAQFFRSLTRKCGEKMQTRNDANHTSRRRTPSGTLTVRIVPSAQFFRSLTRKCGEKCRREMMQTTRRTIECIWVVLMVRMISFSQSYRNNKAAQESGFVVSSNNIFQFRKCGYGKITGGIARVKSVEPAGIHAGIFGGFNIRLAAVAHHK